MSLLVLLQEVVQAAVDLAPLAKLGAALAAGIVTIGAGLGIGFATKGLIWPVFYTGVFYLISVGLLTILFGKLEKKMSFYKE